MLHVSSALRDASADRRVNISLLGVRAQMVASLGPPGEFFEGSGLGSEAVHDHEAEVGMKGVEAGVTDAMLASLVQLHPDKLSCARMLLAAARTFASHKINTLSADVEAVAGQLG